MDQQRPPLSQQQSSFEHPQRPPAAFFDPPRVDTTLSLQAGAGRQYKSRKYRPCDFCRARQVACKIDSTPPCQLCSSHGRQCTFVDRPKKKRRPNAPAANGTPDPPRRASESAAMQPQYEIPGGPSGIGYADPYHHDQHFDGVNRSGSLDIASTAPLQHLGASQEDSPMYNVDPYLQIMSAGLTARPLESQANKSARLIGETGESNPYLLRHYRYDENDECTISSLTYRRVRSAGSQNAMPNAKEEPPAVFVLQDDSLALKAEPRVDDEILEDTRSEIQDMFTTDEGMALIGLFFRFVYPYFPIVSKSDFFSAGTLSVSILHDLPTSVLSAVYAASLPFILYDDLLAASMAQSPPPAHQLYRIAWLAITQEMHNPKLATLQACLLLLQRAPTNRFTTDTPWRTSLVGWTVSLAQVLGLTRECGDWVSLPAWEMSLRKRLWYAVVIMDKWASLGAGVPSHVRGDDWDVLPITESDVQIANLDKSQTPIPTFQETEEEIHHFRLLSELTMILSDIMDSYYSLRATQRTSKDFLHSLELARPLRSRLKVWNDSLPPALALRHPERLDARGMVKLSGNPSLSLAYIVATMTLFRALLRPLENLTRAQEEDQSIISSRNVVRAGAKECAKDVVEFVENLGRGALDAFWHSWSRANFAIASSFLMQLLVTSESEAETNEINDLVGRWRWAMRIGSGSNGSDLMSLGLLRLDGLLLENGPPATGMPRPMSE